MSVDRFAEQIRSFETLTALIGTPSQFSLRKELHALDEYVRRSWCSARIQPVNAVTHRPVETHRDSSTSLTSGRC